MVRGSLYLFSAEERICDILLGSCHHQDGRIRKGSFENLGQQLFPKVQAATFPKITIDLIQMVRFRKSFPFSIQEL